MISYLHRIFKTNRIRLATLKTNGVRVSRKATTSVRASELALVCLCIRCLAERAVPAKSADLDLLFKVANVNVTKDGFGRIENE
jgi:hypothetical protein